MFCIVFVVGVYVFIVIAVGEYIWIVTVVSVYVLSFDSAKSI